jgi:hypothetical protein
MGLCMSINFHGALAGLYSNLVKLQMQHAAEEAQADGKGAEEGAPEGQPIPAADGAASDATVITILPGGAQPAVSAFAAAAGGWVSGCSHAS